MSGSLAKISQDFQRKDILLTDKYLSKTPFHSGFWSRKLVDEAVASSAQSAHGVLLDIGCGAKPYREIFAPFVEKHLGLEYSPESGYRENLADFCGDAAALPLANESIDTILCTEVMEHLPNPEKTIEEFARILRPNGTVIITAPFFYPVHDAYDFFRYTADGIPAIMKRYGLTVELVKPHAGTGITLATMFNYYWYDFGFLWTKWLYPIGLLLRPLLWILIFLVNMLGWIGDKIIKSDQIAIGYLTIAKKK